MLHVPEAKIRRNGPGHVLAVCWRQWQAERRLRRRGIQFRSTDEKIVAESYAAMTAQEFDAINGRQAWANWRTIPRALSGQVPDKPLHVLDLGAGAGNSTQALAFYCPPGSHIIGYELANSLLQLARQREYRQENGEKASVEFVCQSVTEGLRTPQGELVAEGSVDVVNASGVVGHHLTVETIQPLIVEMQRILAPEAMVTLDVGPSLDARQLASVMTTAGFRYRCHCKSWWLDPTGQLVFQR